MNKREFKVNTLWVFGLRKAPYKSGTIVNESHFSPGHADKLLKSGHLVDHNLTPNEIKAKAKAEKEAAKLAEEAKAKAEKEAAELAEEAKAKAEKEAAELADGGSKEEKKEGNDDLTVEPTKENLEGKTPADFQKPEIIAMLVKIQVPFNATDKKAVLFDLLVASVTG